MGKGREYLQRLHEVLREFEEAVVAREKWKPLESKVSRQQEVDSARQKVVDFVVQLVTAERIQKEG
ncbi:MAG: hypothetical protein GTN62_10025 [Gemmatimonadales bacterium]|nr:hypothetical protein [Gemmatimonadales bacterium]NIN11882.1 hypothetical protein [Gemmatimonadales bacterium]NIN50432.1 hypothetical protein [Gemmatimonadales bacterium]NIP07896.1 hypothetical protein [Gemmatimonadales bacterium]NIR01920.1 hypothetical protein [Gemmatimonadales bacterium]